MFSPSSAVVRKIFLPQTIGDEWPRPAIAVFHFTFFASLHSVGSPVSVETPWPAGPRHCGQFAPPDAPAFELRSVRVKRKLIRKARVMRLENFILDVPFFVTQTISLQGFSVSKPLV